MKIISPLILVNVFLISLSVLAQPDEKYKTIEPKRFIYKFELIGGPTLQLPDDNGFSERLKQSSMGTILTSFNSKYGYSFGAGLAHSLRNRFDIVARVLLERKGYIEETSGTNGFKYIGDSKNDYITLNVHPSFFLDRKENMQIVIGSYFSWLQGAFRRETSSLNGQTTITSTTNDPNLHSIDFGVTFGAGYSIVVDTKSKISFLLLGNYGLNKIININTLTINNNSISFFVTYSRSRFPKQTH